MFCYQIDSDVLILSFCAFLAAVPEESDEDIDNESDKDGKEKSEDHSDDNELDKVYLQVPGGN